MLQLSRGLIGQSVMSLRTGGEVGKTVAPIINPDNFKIEGFYCQDRFNKGQMILLSQDIRDIIDKGIVVNDHDVLADPSELVRLKDVLRIKYDVMNKPVMTISKEKVGKINDYAVEMESMYIQKLYVGQSILKSISGGQLSVDRSQIVEITDKKIIIQELIKPIKNAIPAGVPVTS